MIVVSYVLAFLALIALIGSFIYSPNYSASLTNIATVISIILGVLSIVYSSKSNKSTDTLLKDIRVEFENVAKNAQTSLIEKNIGNENYKNVEQMIDKRLNDKNN